MKFYIKKFGAVLIIAAFVLLGTSAILLSGKLVYAVVCLFV